MHRNFFNGYKSVDIDYTNENKTSVWYNDVSEYSDRETIDSITRFYYDMKVKGLVESKKFVRNSIKVGDVVKNKNRDDLFGLVYKVEGERITMYVIDKDTHTYNTRDAFTGNSIDYEKVNFKVAPMEESKKSARKSLKESVEFSKEKDIYIAQIKDSSISFAYTPIDTDNDFNGYFVFDGDDVIEYLNWKGADANDMLKAFNDFEKAVKKVFI